MGKRIAVIGAGNGGTAIAGDLTLAGHECRLFEFEEWAGNVTAVNEKGGIKVTGVAHTRVAHAIAPLVRDGHVVILWPGSGGSLEIRRVFDELGVKADVLLGEGA